MSKPVTVLEKDVVAVNLPDNLAQTVSSNLPAPLANMTPTLVDEVKQRCLDNVKAILDGDSRTTIAQLSELGIEDQRAAARELELLKRPVGEMLQKSQQEDPVEVGLIELRKQVDQINPAELQKGGPAIQLIAKLPLLGPILAALLRPAQQKVLYRISVQHESVSEFIDHIVEGIRLGMDTLDRDNLELETLYRNFFAQQLQIAEAHYEGLVQMWAITQESSNHAPGSKNRRALDEAMTQVTVRVQDLAVMYEVNAQAFVGIDMTKANNKTLRDAAERSLTVTTNLLTISLAIQAALGRQLRVAKAVTASREAAGNMLTANAAAIRQQTTQIGEIYTNPSVAMDKLQQAHDDLIASLDAVEVVKRVGTEQAQKNILALGKMSHETMDRAAAVRIANSETDQAAR